ncbi:MAG: hypothetical protein ACRELF_12510 [Gemmataceae bacterium]
MRALTTRAVVSADHTLTMPVPEDVSPGEHQVTVMIEEAALSPSEKGSLMDWPAHAVALVEPRNTFRREDLYCDDGR